MAKTPTIEELMDELITHPSMSLPKAGRLLDIGESSTYAAVKNGTFPVKVVKIGGRYIVPTAPLRSLLGITEQPTEVA